MLPSMIRKKLREIRRILRFCSAVDGFGSLVFALVGLFFLDILADRFLEFSVVLRFLLLLSMIAGICVVIWKTLLLRILCPVRDDQLARLLEHRVPRFHESLITSVEARSEESSDGQYHHFFVERTVQKATKVLKSVEMRSLFRFRRLYLRSALALCLLFLLGGFCIAFTETAEIWFSRNILLSQKQWPRLSRIHVEGFDAQNRAKIAKGDSFPLLVLADTTAPQVPVKVRVDIAPQNAPGKVVQSFTIDQFTSRFLRGKEYRSFLHTIPELLDPVLLSISAGDTHIEGLLIEVVPPPGILRSEIVFHYPKYMKRSDSASKPTDRIIVPEGTGLLLKLQGNKPLQSASLSLNGRNAEPVSELHGDSFSYAFPDCREEKNLEFTLEDLDGIQNRRSIRYSVEILKDKAPSVSARLDGIGQSITPIAVLPILGEVLDDYGIAEIQARYTVVRSETRIRDQEEEGDPAQDGFLEDSESENFDQFSDPGRKLRREGDQPIAVLNGSITNHPLDFEFSISELSLVPGDRLSLQIEARDAFSLPETLKEKKPEIQGPHFGAGDRWDFEIVSPARLKGILEAREIVLRQRFEALIAEVRRTRDILEEMDFEKPENAPQSRISGEISDIPQNRNAKEESGKNNPTENHSPGIPESSPSLFPEDSEEQMGKPVQKEQEREPTDPPTPFPVKNEIDTISSEQASQGAYCISRVLRDSEKEKYELQGIIGGFENIRKEMVNNQIFTPETQERIDERIMNPIHSVIEKEFHQFDKLLEEFAVVLEKYETISREQAQKNRLDSLEQLDRILAKLSAILEQMVQMETFNEAVELLKEIIREQETLRKETDAAKKDQLRRLLD